MELDRTAIVGIGGVLVGFVLAYAVGSSGRAALEAQLRQQGDVAASVAALEERLTALDGKLDTGLAAVTEQVGAAAAGPGEDLRALAERVEGLGGDLGRRLEGLAPNVRETLSRDFEGVRGELRALAERGEAAAGAALGAIAGREAVETEVPVGDPAAATGEGVEIGVGQTAQLGDGAVRVFLSGADEAAGLAWVVVNGAARQRVAPGGSLAAGECTVVMTGLGDGTATFDASCGDAAAAPAAESGAAAATADSGAAESTGAGTELRIGQTATFADGAVRVFLSAVDEAGGAARLSVNGAAPGAIAVGEAQDIGPCRVTVTGVAGGVATVDGAC